MRVTPSNRHVVTTRDDVAPLVRGTSPRTSTYTSGYRRFARKPVGASRATRVSNIEAPAPDQLLQ